MAKFIRPPFVRADKYVVGRRFVYNGATFAPGDSFIPALVKIDERKLQLLYEQRKLNAVPRRAPVAAKGAETDKVAA